ncbi:hypothetical protein OS493_012788 [Desmophyllum pertusum]|uniref:ZP domain-containing protein n=1 Tax=Desmophyllum pertusum TaxID=174260 RepID=A0A9W9ZE37_9CNID|nr:hypothetical protein OS493_012788 [Desmophyllum pertusum]
MRAFLCGVDAVVTAVSCNSDDEDKVDFDAYRFVTSVEGDDIYIFVTAEVCPADQVDSSCKTDCEACNPTKRRKRRETGQEIQQTQYYLKAGPYKINRNTEEARKDAAAGKDDVTHLPAYVVAVAAVGGVVAVAIVCATVLIVLRNRRQNTAIAEPRDQADVTA